MTSRKVMSVLLSLVFSYLNRRPAFTWSPAVDLSDNAVRSTLLPGSVLS